MIGDLITEVFSSDQKKDLLLLPMVAVSLFRSFDEFTKNLILRAMANRGIEGGFFEKTKIIEEMDRTFYEKEGNQLLRSTTKNLVDLQIIIPLSQASTKFTLYTKFQEMLLKNMNLKFSNGEELEAEQMDNKKHFNLLLLIQEQNNNNNTKKSDILAKCGLAKFDPQKALSRPLFNYIRKPVSYKISVLIQGYLKYKKQRDNNSKVIKDILYLSMMKIDRKYKKGSPQASTIIQQLELLNLVKSLPNGYFTISKHFHKFAFNHHINDDSFFKCDVVIETNFKIYVTISHTENSQLLRRLLSKLIKFDHHADTMENLVVGKIDPSVMQTLFQRSITVADYFDFFKIFIAKEVEFEKDLGKWNKMAFLGLSGPSEENVIPNNVKQQLRLWESLFEKGENISEASLKLNEIEEKQ